MMRTARGCPHPAMSCLVLLFALSLISGCGAVSNGNSLSSRLSSVVVTPSTAEIRAGDTQLFAALAFSPLPVSSGSSNNLRPRSGADIRRATNHRVTWSVNGIPGGNATVGTIDAKGLYTAPATIPNPDSVTVTAISPAEPSVSAVAQVTLDNPIPMLASVLPNTVSVGSFSLTINGSKFVKGAQVRLAGSTLQTTFNSASQLTAIGTASQAQVGDALISVKNPDPGSTSSPTVFNIQVTSSAVSVSTSPSTAVLQAGRAQQFTATVTGTADTTVTWLVAGTPGGSSTLGRISPTGLYTAPQTVPPNASLAVTARSNADPSKSGSATVMIPPLLAPVSVSISPRNATLQTGLSQQFTAAITGTTNTGITWLVNGIPGGNAAFGSISSAGLYVAPQSVPNPPSATITASSKYDPSSSADTTVMISTALGQTSSSTGATYYVDASAGNDSNNGRSATTAWRTIAKVNLSSFVPGDQVLFKRGEVWREQLRNSSSGVAGKPITYGAYGTGQKPSIRGSNTYDKAEAWMSEGNTLWYVTGIQTDPGVFVEDGVLAVRRTTKAGLSGQWDYWYDSSNSRFYVYSTANPATAGRLLEIAVRDAFVATQSWSYVTYENLDIRQFKGEQTWLGWRANNITFQDDDFSQLARYGLQFHNGSANGTVSHCTFTDWGVVDGQDYAVHVIGKDSGQTTGPVDVIDSTFTINHRMNNTELAAVLGDIHGWVRNVQRNSAINNGRWPGTAFWTWRPGRGATSINFESNSTYRTGSSGIEVQELNYNGATPPTKIRYNYVEDADQLDLADTEALRVWGFNSSTNVEVSYNVINRTQKGAHPHPGIYLYNATGTRLYGNTIYGADDGILVKGASLNTDIRNNISVLSRNHGITVQDSSTVTVFGNNLFYGNTDGNYNGIGAGAGDVLSDPKFASSNPTSPASFELQPNSPAINSGAALASPQSNALRPGSNWPTNVGTVDQNLRGAWGIGAFAYVGP